MTLILDTQLTIVDEQVREQAGSILHEFFPWPLPGGSTSELMLKALVLCNSCHARECQSGAALCNLIFSKSVKPSTVKACYYKHPWGIKICFF